MTDLLGDPASGADSRETSNANPEAGEEASEEDFVWWIVHFASGIEQDGVFEQEAREHLGRSRLQMWRGRGIMAMSTAVTDLRGENVEFQADWRAAVRAMSRAHDSVGCRL